MAEVKSAPKKGNKTTEIIIGSGAAKLTSAVAALSSVVEVINKFSKLMMLTNKFLLTNGCMKIK
jgi:hypothetical protein